MTRLTHPEQPLSIGYFGHDARETAVQKRILSFTMNGCHVVGFTFCRRDQAERAAVPFENIPLGTTVDRNYLRRLLPLARGLVAALRRARVLRDVDIIQARNLDMFALAIAAKFMSGAKARLVYEVLDVQRILVGKGWASALARTVERQLLKAADLLVVSSPDFMNEYFGPIQNYRGPWHLLQNKISGSQIDAAPRAYDRPADAPPEPPPWVIGWFGVLRCRRSLDILTAIADELGPKVTIYIRGRLSREDISEVDFLKIVNARSNMVFEGPYASPEDLAAIYGKVHFSWSIDYTDEGANSDWLLPNRLYEGGYFDVVALARKETTTGRMILEHQLGIAFPDPIERSVSDFIRNLEIASYEAQRAAVITKPRSLFVDRTDTIDYLKRLKLLGQKKALHSDHKSLQMDEG